MPKATPLIYQLKFTLRDSKPPIWRRVVACSDFTFADLHDLIQLAMGWMNSHLHEFRKGQNIVIGDPDLDEGFGQEILDESKIRLDSILKQEKQKILYMYDFGDGWEHDILLEKILPYNAQTPLPHCVKGKRACPPEDVGGVWGYEDFLEAIGDSWHPDHADMLDWIEGHFDPDAFDLDETNRLLRKHWR